MSIVKPSLARDGFAHYYPEIEYEVIDEVELKHEFDVLEVDPFAPQGVNRFRRYANGVIMPWKPSSDVHWMPPVEDGLGKILAGYDQGGNNPDHSNIRYFNSLSVNVKTNRLLNKLILDDFSHTFWDWTGQPFPIYFGVHFVKLQSHSPHDLGISSPNLFHQDGEPFTFAHLVHRSSNACGGINYIGTTFARNKSLEEVSEGDIVRSFTLNAFLESFAVFDPAVSHYVSPISKMDSTDSAAERCMILIDFSKTRQNI
ncbi:2OG-Fe dioxygenase family protein [Pseudomonas yamanorum]|uniref:2OG-Fe dioxygenase family protein n=1 Tax=Pseudomonas yamanorum TaxID=515393 RepID=UPI003F74C59F